MKEQMSVTELIQTVSQSMKGDGLKQDYITQLSYTWKALEQYLAEYDLIFSRDTAFSFLKDKYGIHADQNFSRLRPIGKRRKRAICALLYCADGLLLGSSYSQMVVPSVYRTDEIEKMLVSFNQSSAVGIRNYAMVLMAARLGMRASNICA